MDPDRHLVRLAKNGNKAAFAKLARRYRDLVLALAFDFLKEYESAKDVAQDVFMKAFKNIGDFEEKSRFSSWLYRITVNACLDARKSDTRRRRYLFSKIDQAESDYRIEESNQSNGLDDSLSKEINNLSDQQRAAIVLRYFHDKSVREIAEVLDCTENTVRSHLYRALHKLDKSYRKRISS
jgi:RNA polymerase sigma-70 factor (ECF subfamily)